MPKPFKPTYPQLALLDWLNERPGARFLVSSNMGSRTSDFDMFEADGKNEETGKFAIKRYEAFGGDEESKALTDRLGGSRAKVDLTSLIQQGILRSGNSLYPQAGTLNFEKFVSQLDVREGYFHYSSTLFLLAKAFGAKYWEETGRALFEDMKAKRAAQRARAERLVLVGRVAPIEPEFPASLIKKLPKGLVFPIPNRFGLRPQAYATVVKETDKRLYLEDINYVREIDPYRRNDPSVIQGYKDKFVEREHVIIDYATPEIINKITALDNEYQEDVTRIATDFAERMLPIMQEMDQRFLQKDNEREMVIAEAIEDFKTSSDTGPKSPRKR
jgi:hypothetical protein